MLDLIFVSHGRMLRFVIGAILLLPPSIAFAEDAEPSDESGIVTFDEIVVTTAGSPEELSKIASTVQVIDAKEIRESSSSTITGLLQERAAAFFSEWTPGQTSITMRGARSDGQGRDFRGQVLVLLNGRRAGTANLSKLSPSQLHRIEIVRGPASVAYGNQAMGGVINLITRNGRSVEVNTVSIEGGDYGYGQVKAEYSTDLSDGLSSYIGVVGSASGDYDGGSGSAEQINTESKRFGALAALNWDLHPNHWLDLSLRTDGVYDAGFRGSSWDFDNNDDRWNRSFDLTYVGVLEDRGIDLNAHLYAFSDVDSFHWGSEAAGVDEDNNRRELTAYGVRLTPQFNLTESTRLLLGFDGEHSRLRNTRERISVSGAPIAQVPPFDNNENNLLTAGYAELTQSLVDERITLRAGARYTRNELSLKDTPNVDLGGDTDRAFDGTTYSLGVAYAVSPSLKTRASYATGFRSPTGRELAGEFSPVLTPNRITRGNGDLDAEESEQFEIGLTYAADSFFFDVAVFDQTIEGRITTTVIDEGGPGRDDDISQFVNADGDAEVQGFEIQVQGDAAPLLDMAGQRLLLGADLVWNFDMQADGIDRRDSGPYAEELQRLNEYKASLRLDYEWRDRWGIRVSGVLHGPMFYDTEERLLVTAEPARNFVHRKGSFWVFNLRGHFDVTDRITFYGGIDNLFDKNEHPIFIAIDEQPFISDPARSNGGRGNSMRGRFPYVGVRVSF
ncbi:MAG: TonB-dependent receptor [Thermoanaerobaculia bacterium]|nr:TonB-dependent receptor [Thermoanaerobaculia bacterium]